MQIFNFLYSLKPDHENEIKMTYSISQFLVYLEKTEVDYLIFYLSSIQAH